MATLTACTAISVLTLNMFLPSLAHIAEDLQADYALVNLSVGGYLLITGVLQLIMGPVSDRFGRRPVLLLSTAVFVLASIGCMMAETVWVFLGFRLLQGGMIAGQVLSRAAIRDMYPPGEAASKLGYVSMAMALAPMLGPMLGGALEMAFGWRSGFALYTVLGLGMMALLWADFGETNQHRAETFARQFREYPRLFTSRRFWGYALCVACSIGGFFAFITGAPMVAAAWFDLSPAMLGLGIGIITSGFMVGSFLTARLAARVPLIRLILIGRVVAVLGPLAGLLLFAAGQGNIPVFFGSAICVGFGNGLTIANASAGLMSVRPDLAGSASGMMGALTAALGALLTGVTGALVSAANAPFAVLGTMLAASVLALLAAVFVLWVDLRDPASETA